MPEIVERFNELVKVELVFRKLHHLTVIVASRCIGLVPRVFFIPKELFRLINSSFGDLEDVRPVVRFDDIKYLLLI